jgi:hypothetical protein
MNGTTVSIVLTDPFSETAHSNMRDMAARCIYSVHQSDAGHHQALLTGSSYAEPLTIQPKLKSKHTV